MSYLAHVFVLAMVFILSACSGSSNAPAPVANTNNVATLAGTVTSISGVVVKGAVKNSTVSIYSLDPYGNRSAQPIVPPSSARMVPSQPIFRLMWSVRLKWFRQAVVTPTNTVA